MSIVQPNIDTKPSLSSELAEALQDEFLGEEIVDVPDTASKNTDEAMEHPDEAWLLFTSAIDRISSDDDLFVSAVKRVETVLQ